MSDVSSFSMVIFHERDLFHAFQSHYGLGEEIVALLLPNQSPSERRNLEHTRRWLSASTRNGWFKGAMKEILSGAKFERLKFLSEESCTHSFVGDADQRYELTVVKDSHDLFIAEIDKMMEWCRSNPAEATKFDPSWADDVGLDIDRAFFSLRPKDEVEEDGCGYHFLFCVLKTVGDLLRSAQHQDQWAIYINEVNPNL